VLLPVWRAPVTTIAGMTRKRSERAAPTSRGRVFISNKGGLRGTVERFRVDTTDVLFRQSFRCCRWRLTINGDGTLWIAMNFGASGWAHASVPKSAPVISATSINSSSRIYAVVLSDNTIWTYNGSSWSQLTGGRANANLSR
jgi:hypothetical protein